MSKSKSKIVRCPVRAIASEIRRLAKFHGANVHLNDRHTGVSEYDAGEDYSIDVRLQVHESGQWSLHFGDSSYDQDHRGVWGSSSIPVCRGRDGHLRVARFDSMAMARSLWNQAVDMAVDGFDGPELAYVKQPLARGLARARKAGSYTLPE